MLNKIDLNKLKRYSLSKRPSKVDKDLFAKVIGKGSSFKRFYESLPKVLAVNSLKQVVEAIRRSHKNKKEVIFMMGAHVLKCGLSPLIIELMKRKVLTAIALNGAGIIHDVEIAMAAKTSEEVATGIKDGSFGMSKDTADFINTAIVKGYRRGMGLGEAVGLAIKKDSLKFKDLSILYKATMLDVAVTVHAAIGTDIIHQHPSCNGEAIGATSLKDFHKFIEVVSRLEGGVIVNIGSAVILPEVFLKALTVARNLGYKVNHFTAGVFDMYHHYRPQQNVLTRPTSCGGKQFYILGHHEILVPLLFAAILENI